MNKIKTALTIAGSDCSGGAGIQADLKTMIQNGVYGMSAITALTAQNTMGVSDILEVTPNFLGSQLDRIFEDIFPDAVKIGMVSSPELMKVIAEKLIYYKAKNIVLDPVMVATSGAKLMNDSALSTLKEYLFPIANLITPNIPEAEILADEKIHNKSEMENVAKLIFKMYNTPVLLKGGHSVNDANDFLYDGEKGIWIEGERIENENTHGTGCTLSSAITSNLAKGYGLKESIVRAKEYISEALADMLDLGKGSGPLNHGFNLSGKYSK